jgi:hypothetical protein
MRYLPKPWQKSRGSLPGRLVSGLPGQGEHLEKLSVKGDEIFFQELISGLKVIFHGNPEQRADFVITIEREPIPVSRQDQKEIEEQLLMVEAHQEAVPEEPMFDKSKTSGNLADALMAQDDFVDHGLSPPFGDSVGGVAQQVH